MKKIQNLQIHNLGNSIAYCEAIGLAKCFASYANYCTSEHILDIKFNANSGYTYIALENGVTICSMLGERVEYLVCNTDTGDESFFDSYYEAINLIEL